MRRETIVRKKPGSLLVMLILLTLCLPGMATASASVTQITSGSYETIGTAQQTVSSSAAKGFSDKNQFNISEEQAREILKNMFPEIMQGKDLQADYSEQGPFNKKTWNFRPRDLDYGPGPNGPKMNASVDALTGEIINIYYNPEAAFYKGKQVNLSREQALPIAQEFLKKIQPNKIGMLTVKETDPRYSFPKYYYYGNGLNMHYMFYWSRMANGIVVDWDSIQIGVNAATGLVTHYNYSWHDCELPRIDMTISKEELTRKLVDESGMYPSYVPSLDGNSSNVLVPVYVLNSITPYYDCHSGQGLNQDGNKIAAKDKLSYQQVFTPRDDGSGIEGIPPAAKKINPELAKKAAEEFFKFLGIPGEVEKSGGGTSSMGFGLDQEHWNYSIKAANRDRNPNNWAVGIDVYSGEVVSFHHYNDRSNDGGNPISVEQALEKATTAIQKINPEKQKLVVLQKEPSQNSEDQFSFNFVRLKNGIPCEQQGIRIDINKANGEILSCSVRWYPAQFSSLANIISPEKAQEIYSSQQPFELAYIFPRNAQTGEQETKRPLLVYRTQKNRVDAISGKMFDYTIMDNPTTSTSFTGHWAAAELSLLAENGLMPAEGIQADGEMSRRQSLKVLVATMTRQNYGDNTDVSLAFTDIKSSDPDIEVFKRAVKEGVIPNQGKFEPDKAISREDLAVWLVNSLGYQEIAGLKNRIATPFQDADKIATDKANCVGLVDGLGILKADANQCFRPQAAITWAEMASLATRLGPRIPVYTRY